jgi:predicted anti-sigma-YlaC factor YlaD
MVALMELILFGCWLWPRFEFGAVGIFTDVLVSLLLYVGKIQSVVFSTPLPQRFSKLLLVDF